MDRLSRDVSLIAGVTRLYRAIGVPRPDSPRTIADRFEEQVEAGPERIALIQGDRQLRYAELDAQANRFAHWARSIGIGRGDVVALLLGNRPEVAIAQLGLAKLGAVGALINHHLQGKALAHCVRVARARCAVVHAEFSDAWQSAAAQQEGDEALPVYSLGGAVAGAEPLEGALAEASPASLDPSVRTGLLASDPYLYIYTSGTTGLPKAARVSHLRAISMAGGAIASLELGPGERLYIPLPLYHSAGNGMALGGALLSGAAAILAPRFSASQFWADCVRHEATCFQYIGELCRYLINSPEHPDERRHAVRACLGNGLRPEVWGPFQERFGIGKIVEFYGATEGNVAMINYDGKIGAVGRQPAPLRRALGTHILRYDVERDEHPRDAKGFCIPCEPDEVGEAVGRISAVARFEGYTNEEATEKKILRDVFQKGDTYFRTGDLLRMDAEGYFYFVDRIGDTFRWKGENVATSEIAEVLSVAPGVAEANVYGVEVPGQEGRAGMAALVTADGFDADELYALVERSLPTYARPLFLRIGKQIETTGTFKHRKLDLVKEGFDPAAIPDSLYFADTETKRYVPLSPEVHARIVNGEIRL